MGQFLSQLQSIRHLRTHTERNLINVLNVEKAFPEFTPYESSENSHLRIETMGFLWAQICGLFPEGAVSSEFIFLTYQYHHPAPAGQGPSEGSTEAAKD